MYKITSYESEKNMLQAALLNSAKEVEYLEFLAEVLPEYTGVLNKRFETFISKKLAEKYGTYEYKHYDSSYGEKAGTPSEYDRTINNVTPYLSGQTYVSDRKYWKLGMHYKGTEYNRYDQKLVERNQTLELYSWESLDELAKHVQGKIEYTNKEIAKIKKNIQHLDSYARTYNKLVDQIAEYNDKISYVIADSYRIK